MRVLIAVGTTLLGAFLFQMPSTPPMKMGLWETTSSTKMTGIDLPPGVNAPGLAGRTMTIRSCMTPETYQKNLMAGQRSRDCTVTNEKWTEKSYSADVSCSSGATKGHIDMSFASREASHGVVHMEINQGGKAIVFESVMDSKFVSADLRQRHAGQAGDAALS